MLERKGVEVLASPTLLQYALTSSHIESLNKTAYVKDYEVQVASAAFIANPVIDTVEEGWRLQTSVTRLRGGVLGVSLNVSIRELQRPIKTYKTALGVGSEVEIQLPDLIQTGIETAIRLPSDVEMLLLLPSMLGRRYLALVSITEVDLDGRKVR